MVEKHSMPAKSVFYAASSTPFLIQYYLVSINITSTLKQVQSGTPILSLVNVPGQSFQVS